MTTAILPPGKYFVGDPCYVFSDDDWNRMIDEIMYPPGNPDGYNGEYTFNHHRGWFYHTAFGDGVFFDDDGTEYGVDAGCIGVTPIAIVSKERVGMQLEDLGRVVEFDTPFECEYDNGTFYLGHLEIPTNFNDDE